MKQLIILIIFLVTIIATITVIYMLNKVNNQPTADKINHLVKNHHEEINDYYYWLRDKNWPNVFNKEIINHLKSENTYTNKFFEPLKELESSFYKELKNNIIDYEETYPIKKDNFFIFQKLSKIKIILLFAENTKV